MKIDFNKGNGLVPVIIQDNCSLEVLMLGYMNKEAFEKTIKEKIVTFYSRSKQRLWTKGETSGNILHVKQVEVDCDNDTILIFVTHEGPVCHKGNQSCFNSKPIKGFLYRLEDTISAKIDDNVTDSYTNSLFKKGINKVAQKVGEESVELIIEAKDDNDTLFRNEAADLFYHTLILLKAKDVKLEEIEKVLYDRAR